MEVTTPIKDWAVIKGKIFTPKNNFYGLMVVFFDNKKNTIENLNLVFSIFSETHEIGLPDSWSTFEKTIQDMVYGARYSQAITMSATDKLKADTQSAIFAGELKSGIDKNDLSLVNTLFKHTFTKILNDETVEVECNFEKISNDELQQGRIREETGTSNITADFENLGTPPDYRFVNAKLILAPVDGKLITDLQTGDWLLLNLVVTSMVENTIIDKLKLRKPDGTAKPVPARLVKIQPYTKGFQLLLNITENYYAKIIEEERILVKTAAPGANAEKNKPVISKSPKNIPINPPKSSQDKTGSSWITIALIVVLGMALIYFLFVSG